MAAPVVLLCGHLTADRGSGGLIPGGSVYYAGRTHHALGARTRVFTAAATAAEAAAALAGLETTVVPCERTTTFTNRYGPDGRRTQRVDAVAPPLDPARLPPGWRRADLLHLAPVIGEVDLRAFRAAVGARFTGIVVQGWVRAVAPDGAVTQPPWRPAPEELRGVDAACVGEDDLLGQGDLAERLCEAIPVVAFTHGPAGCEVVVSGRRRPVGAYATREVDPTGAGDVFSAGFFLALAAGRDPVEAARLGAAAASIVVEGVGGETLGRIGEAAERVAGVPVPG